MSGKSKQPRVKNNAKPSSSSRSAELLGNSVAKFVGFSVHTEHGLIPLAPGVSDNWTDALDSNINPQLNLILRKMSKKDPITKVKALQEFSEFLNNCDVSEAKISLPLWPKLYQNLANDVDHRVRQSSQEVMNIVALKFKKALAPYLKQLVPIWISSQFDNYAPVATIASSSFNETFTHKVRDVCLFCRNEILEYVVRNITFHSASTFSSSKNCNAEEAEQRYLRVVYCSLKTVSLFLQEVNVIEHEEIKQSLQGMLRNSKFWSLSKSKDPRVKGAWFEVLYTVLLNKSLESVVTDLKNQIITVTFQNVSDSEPLVTRHVWGCILLQQSMFKDWYDVISFKKNVIPKLSSLLRHGCNRNFEIISPNLLLFLSQITAESLEDTNIYDFYKQFFDDIKEALFSFGNTSKASISAILAAYFECLRYVLQQIDNNINEEPVGVAVTDLETIAARFFSENIFDLLTWSFTKGGFIAKLIMMHTSMLIAFWSDPAKQSKLYVNLLNTFWKNVTSFTLSSLSNEQDNEIFLDHITEFINKLYNANSKIEHQKVKFVLENEENAAKNLSKQMKNSDFKKHNIDHNQIKTSDCMLEPSMRKSTSVLYFESDLKNLVIEVGRFCLAKCSDKFGSRYIPKIRKLTLLFNDVDFYARITESESPNGVLNEFIRIMDTLDDGGYDDVIDMTFEVLNFLPKDERIDFIKEQLLKTSHLPIQRSVMNRLLSYPLVIEPGVAAVLSYPETYNILIGLAKNVINCNSKESLTLLRKCFFQNDKGKIPINKKTAEDVIEILSETLNGQEMVQETELCASFIAQIMPVISAEGNTSPEFQRKIFLTLFQFAIENTCDKFISEDTIWEISTGWQDALTSQDIFGDIELLKECKAIVEKYMRKDNNFTIENIESIATSITQFIICSSEHIKDDQEYFSKVNQMMENLFETTDNGILNTNIKRIEDLCLFLEVLSGNISTDLDLNAECFGNIEILMTLRLMLLQCCIIYKLICKKPKKNRSLDDSTENIVSKKDRGTNQWSPVIYNETLKCISVVTACDSLLNILQGEHSWKIVLLQLTEKIKLLLYNGNENFIYTLKCHMLKNVLEGYNIAAIRNLLYLAQINYYYQFEESATIVLFEDVLKIVSSKNSIDFRSYVNMLQFFLPQLSPKSMTLDMYIIKETTFDDIWKRSAILRCLVHNNFNQDFNTTSDHEIIQKTLELLVKISEHHLLHTGCLLYDVKIHEQSFTNVLNTAEFMNILQTSILNFPYKLTVQNWDAVRIGLSAWLLSLSKSIEHIENPQVVIFLVSVFKLYSAFGSFINDQRQKSSTEVITKVIDEWDSLFDRDISIIIFKIYRNVVEYEELDSRNSLIYNTILENLSPAMEYINYGTSLKYYKSQTTNENILGFLLENLANRIHCIRTSCGRVVKRLTQYFVEQDVATYENKIENLNTNATTDWHFLSMFEEYIKSYEGCISKYLNEFNFKLSAIDELETMDRNDSLSYMFLWDCIIHVCANSPISLRSIYTNWLQDKQHEEKFLLFLFRAMPTEILKNHDSKLMCTDVFKGLAWNQIQDRNLAVEKYACHLYTEMLRKLPALVRKWWSACQSRQKTFIDKLTTNFVSPIICAEELKALGDKKEKHENMQVTVHTSTREVLAVYSIDDVRMELLITLALNHPLGSVKVEAGKQIGGRLSSRNTGMQLTIFLTHQNGSIFDGLTLWKKNLDKKFDGIEECYVCYSVIHHDTCQLPKLSCKTCKKKFHAPCLYKWFMTSSKSTCPICRNVF